MRTSHLVGWIVTLLSYVYVTVAVDRCPKELPCFHTNNCYDSAYACGFGCDSAKSYKNDSCQPKPNCVDFTTDFKSGTIPSRLNFSGNPNKSEWVNEFEPQHSAINDGKMVLYMVKDSNKSLSGKDKGFGATVSSTRYLDYGSAKASVRSASDKPGVVSSFIVKNDYGDEIDFEWVGGKPDMIQTNYYYDVHLDYGNMKEYPVNGGDTVNTLHEYEILWDPSYIEWKVDGKAVRRLERNSTLKDGVYQFPYRPSLVQFSIWDANQIGEGTEEWAGGATDWSNPNQRFTMYIDELTVSCHYKGNKTGENWPWDNMKDITGTKTSYLISTTSIKSQPTSVLLGDGSEYDNGVSANSFTPHVVAELVLFTSLAQFYRVL
ncbi:putative glycosidase CRH2 [Dispira simplex]|nr:putative glycosidase CRH2 [Dispira simplex]